jgi:CDP-diacylglycerol--glycerol-3-phosphate 3-phosphatidyltransferase
VPTVYALKPRFQAALRPFVGRLARAGVTANQVTVAAAVGSLAVGLLVGNLVEDRALFLLLSLWLLARMALNAIDGMLAREFRQQSRLGAYLNELGDVVSDAALYARSRSSRHSGPPASAASSCWRHSASSPARSVL